MFFLVLFLKAFQVKMVLTYDISLTVDPSNSFPPLPPDSCFCQYDSNLKEIDFVTFTNTFYNLDKYILRCEQILFANQTNNFSNLDECYFAYGFFFFQKLFTFIFVFWYIFLLAFSVSFQYHLYFSPTAFIFLSNSFPPLPPDSCSCQYELPFI